MIASVACTIRLPIPGSSPGTRLVSKSDEYQLLPFRPHQVHCIGRKAIFDTNLAREPLMMNWGRWPAAECRAQIHRTHTNSYRTSCRKSRPTRLAQGIKDSQTGSRAHKRRRPKLSGAAPGRRFPAGGFILDRFLCGCGRFGRDQSVRLTNQVLEFAGGHHVAIGERDPFVTSDVGGRGDAFDFEQAVEASGEVFNVMRGKRPSERTMLTKILPPTLKQRSSGQGMSSVPSGKARQRARIESRSGMDQKVIFAGCSVLSIRLQNTPADRGGRKARFPYQRRQLPLGPAATPFLCRRILCLQK